MPSALRHPLPSQPSSWCWPTQCHRPSLCIGSPGPRTPVTSLPPLSLLEEDEELVVVVLAVARPGRGYLPVTSECFVSRAEFVSRMAVFGQDSLGSAIRRCPVACSVLLNSCQKWYMSAGIFSCGTTLRMFLGGL